MNILHREKQKMSLKGVYKFTKAFLVTPEHFALDKIIREERDRGGDISPLLKILHSICRTEVKVYENLIPTVGRTMIANNLSAVSPTNLMLVKYCELGSGTNAPANGDTAMQTSTYRNAIASRSNASNVGFFTGFFSTTETTGTYREAGIFSDGTASAGTGILLSRVSVNITKSNTETLTLDWEITIS